MISAQLIMVHTLSAPHCYLTGYIPKRLHHFGCRYAETCHYAISSFEDDQQKHKTNMEDLRTLSRRQEDPSARMKSTLAQNTTPLKPISTTPMFYLPSYAQQHSISPFYMPDDHPQKYYVSGYTGFVPKARNYLGQSYPIITRHALQDFAGEEKRMRATWGAPVRVFRPEKKIKSLATIYPKDSGLMPHYTGHIPGEPDREGGREGGVHVHVLIVYSLPLLFVLQGKSSSMGRHLVPAQQMLQYLRFRAD